MQTHLSTAAVSPFLYCFTMSWWVSGSLRTCSFLFFGLGAAAFRVDRARRGNVCLEDQAKACSPTDQPIRKFKDSSGINNEARPGERSDRGRFMPLGKKVSS